MVYIGCQSQSLDHPFISQNDSLRAFGQHGGSGWTAGAERPVGSWPGR